MKIQLKEFLNAFEQVCKNGVLRIWAALKRMGVCLFAHRVLILKACAVLVSVRLLFFIGFLLTTKVFYYGHRLNDSQIIKQRMQVSSVPPESKLQAYVRTYFTGGTDYQIRLPYGGAGQIIGIYHDAKMENLVIDWDQSFYILWQDGIRQQDTALFLRSIKKNFPVKTVRFLVGGKTAGLQWEGKLLDEGISLDGIPLSF